MRPVANSKPRKNGAQRLSTLKNEQQTDTMDLSQLPEEELQDDQPWVEVLRAALEGLH